MIRVLIALDWPVADRLRFGVLLAGLMVSDWIDTLRGRHP